jgi:outer membrane protein TolC
MINNPKKNLFLLLMISMVSVSTFAQQASVTLAQALQLAKINSYEYKVAVNRYQTSLWDYRNVRAAFMPLLTLSGTVPEYNKTISKITLPNGDDSFVNQDQAYSSLNLEMTQQIGATGGSVSLITSLNRLDIFGNTRDVSYSYAPFSISYTQSTIGYNAFKWQKKEAVLTFNSAEKELITNIEAINFQTVTYYFNMLTVQAILNLAKENLASADTLYKMTKERLKLGTVSNSDVLQMELNMLNAENELTSDSSSLVLARQELSRYLAIPDSVNFLLAIPEEGANFYKQIKEGETAMEQEIALQVSKWNLIQKQISVAKETKQIALQSYEMEKQRYRNGSITINDLNIARSQKDNAANNYILVMKSYWELYYTIRKLTLYDFEKNENIDYHNMLTEAALQ